MTLDPEDEWQESYSKWRERRKKTLQSHIPLKSSEIDENQKINETKRLEELKNNISRLRKQRSMSLDVGEEHEESQSSSRNSQREPPTPDPVDPEAIERARSLMNKEKSLQPDQAWADRLSRLSNKLRSSSLSDSKPLNHNFLHSFASSVDNSSRIPRSADVQVSRIKEPEPLAQHNAKNSKRVTLQRRPGATNEENWGFTVKSDIEHHRRGAVVCVDKVKIGSSADLCDLRKGDILLSLDDKPLLDSTNTFLSLDEVKQKLLALSLLNRPVRLLVQRKASEEDEFDFSEFVSDPEDVEEELATDKNQKMPTEIANSISAEEVTSLASDFEKTSESQPPTVQHVALASTHSPKYSLQKAPERTILQTQEATVLSSPSGEFQQPDVSQCEPIAPLPSNCRSPSVTIVTDSGLNLPLKTEQKTLERVEIADKPLQKFAVNATSPVPRVVPFEALETVIQVEDADNDEDLSSIEDVHIQDIAPQLLNFKSNTTKPPTPQGSIVSRSSGFESMPRKFHGFPRTTNLSPNMSRPSSAWTNSDVDQHPRNKAPNIRYLGPSTDSLQSVLNVLENHHHHNHQQQEQPRISEPRWPSSDRIDRAYQEITSSHPSVPPRGGYRSIVTSSSGVVLTQRLDVVRQQSPTAPVRSIIPESVAPAPSCKESEKSSSQFAKKLCQVCYKELGYGDLMIIEKLSLFYHLPCFRCSNCHCPLSDGLSDAEVRVRKGKLFCHACYRRDTSPKLNCIHTPHMRRTPLNSMPIEERSWTPNLNGIGLPNRRGPMSYFNENGRQFSYNKCTSPLFRT